MISTSRALVLLLLALTSHDASAQEGSLWRTLDVSRQLRDSLPKRVRLQYDAGTLDVRGTSDPLLYAMHLRYDETRAEPLHRFDAAEQLAVLGLRSRGRGISPCDTPTPGRVAGSSRSARTPAWKRQAAISGSAGQPNR